MKGRWGGEALPDIVGRADRRDDSELTPAERVLAVILALWEPLNLALFVAPVLTSIATRGTATAAFLLARIVIAGIGIAAGISLWRNDPHARRLAATALILSTVAAAVTSTTTLLPTNIIPGDRWIYLAGVILFNGGWLVYLGWTREMGTVAISRWLMRKW